MLALPFILALPPTGRLGVEVGVGGFRGCERGGERGGAHRVGREDRNRERAATRIHDYRPCTRAQSARRSARDTCFWSSCVGSEALSAFSRPSFPLYFLQMSSPPTPSSLQLLLLNYCQSSFSHFSWTLRKAEFFCALLSSHGLLDFERQ